MPNPNNSRPQEYINTLLRHYPNARNIISAFHNAKGDDDFMTWPDHVFLPMSGFYAMVMDRHKTENLSPEMLEELCRLSAIGTWQFTQGVYRFDEDVYHELLQTPLNAEIKCSDIGPLPEWCIYCETPSLIFAHESVHGFFCYYDWNPNDDTHELRFLIDSDTGLYGLALPMGNFSLQDSVFQACIAATVNHEALKKITGDAEIENNHLAFLETKIEGILNLMLFICTQQSCINTTGFTPTNPKQISINDLTVDSIWRVGLEQGKALREIYSQARELSKISGTVRSNTTRPYWICDTDGGQRKWCAPTIKGEHLEHK